MKKKIAETEWLKEKPAAALPGTGSTPEQEQTEKHKSLGLNSGHR